jgi:preprotein translocase subunit SecD
MARKALVSISFFFCLFLSQSYGQPTADTLFFEIEPEMVQQAEIEELNLENTQYSIDLTLKETYHTKYKRLTGNNVGNFLAVTYEGDILGENLPTIQVEISNGKVPIGRFNKNEDAKKVIQLITSNK